MLRPIESTRGTLADQAYESISSALLGGTIKPGEHLVMDVLAEKLAISRTPVRDALRQLEREGAVSASGRRGFVVSEFTEQDARDLYEARVAIETYAAEAAAVKGESALEHIRNSTADAIRVERDGGHSPMELFTAHMRIHRSFVEATENRFLVELFDGLWSRARGQLAFADYLAHDPGLEEVEADHQVLIEAVAEGPERARTEMREHILHGLDVHLS